MKKPLEAKASISATHLTEPLAKVSLALRKYATAASSQLGADCYLHAELGRILLGDLGVQARLVVGFAAWRIGPGDGDVIGHTPQSSGVVTPGAPGFGYHSWLERPEIVIDFTTYQLRRKAQMLDAQDGGHTTAEWCPNYLLLHRNQIRSYRQVAQAPSAGVAYYEERRELESVLAQSLDPADIRAARLIAASSERMVVVGPNFWSSMTERARPLSE